MPLNSKGLQCSWTDEQLDHAKVRRMVPQISISKKSPSIAKDCSVLELMSSWIMLEDGVTNQHIKEKLLSFFFWQDEQLDHLHQRMVDWCLQSV
jgi:hypothetical protein